MPTYSYRCTECDNAFDIHQSFTDDTLTVCDLCGGRLRKLFNTIGVTFNGSGFYRTDSRSSISSSSESGSGSSGSGSSGSGSGSSGAGSSGSGSSGSGSSSSGSGSSGSGGSSASVA
ncbi:FmdB family zinc ribbon protein [Agromyces laixinhei]|uniref:FmdB family zinc ribbon protein n=1 Tax=Agromyces laixinhei TaxID=2585717 RepID=UPI001117A4AA|nr:FmdB family zinc ribbon protein [Agromyces laixinhei]